MDNRVASIEDRRGGQPQRIGDILAELLAGYESRFPTARFAVVETPAVMEDSSCLFYPEKVMSAS
jgi:hypothetical protein